MQSDLKNFLNDLEENEETLATEQELKDSCGC